ncbi:MAG TPA: hypothetical protein VKE74_05375 [Gemmataceae bacterium]|nr:hypothetical protein [Gemmataceae bacterium]
MKRPNKGGKRIVPQPGGEENQTIEAGPPVYEMPMPPAKTLIRRGPPGEPLVAVPLPPVPREEWEAQCEREGILLPDRPLIPTAEEVGKLPRLARFAFAARCARRVWPIVRSDLRSHPEVAEQVATVLELVEQFATGRGEPKQVAEAGRQALRATDRAVRAKAASSAALTIWQAAHALAESVTGGVCGVSLAAEYAARAVIQAATVQTPIRRQLLCIRRDFDRLKHLARKHNWTDDTPVPPEVFGPMWPADLTPDWAKENPPNPS